MIRPYGRPLVAGKENTRDLMPAPTPNPPRRPARRPAARSFATPAAATSTAPLEQLRQLAQASTPLEEMREALVDTRPPVPAVPAATEDPATTQTADTTEPAETSEEALFAVPPLTSLPAKTLEKYSRTAQIGISFDLVGRLLADYVPATRALLLVMCRLKQPKADHHYIGDGDETYARIVEEFKVQSGRTRSAEFPIPQKMLLELWADVRRTPSKIHALAKLVGVDFSALTDEERSRLVTEWDEERQLWVPAASSKKAK